MSSKDREFPAALAGELKYRLRMVDEDVMAETRPMLLVNDRGHRAVRNSLGLSSDHEVQHAVFLVDGMPYDILPFPLKKGSVELILADRPVGASGRMVFRKRGQ